jgi:hypothetical protein
MVFFMLRRIMIFESNMYIGTLASARSDCMYKEGALATFRTYHLHAHRTSARDLCCDAHRTLRRTLRRAWRRTPHARTASICLDRLCGCLDLF